LTLKGYEWLREQYESEEGQRKIEKVKELSEIADEIVCSMSQLALAWCLKNPNVSTVITGASRPEQISENMAALEVYPRLGDEIMDRIDAVLGNKPETLSDER
jgi:aryl-alcohol dehydrogenase-like predicted oxidoreductase